MNQSILIIGKPHSSKTVFISQLYSRLQKGKSMLSLYRPVSDLSSIITARESLSKGEEPEATPTNNSITLELPIKLGNQEIDLLCPDYGGEQINNIISSRTVDSKWKEAIKNSNNWIFFVRINSINKALDISDITVTKEYVNDGENNSSESYTISDQSSLIELLQIILYIKGNNYHIKNSNIKLTLVLTCWDELNTEKSPKVILKENLPLFLNFAESNWESNNLKIIGLSALGFSLNTPENKELYEYRGPECFGYLIREDGEKVIDITQLITEAIQWK